MYPSGATSDHNLALGPFIQVSLLTTTKALYTRALILRDVVSQILNNSLAYRSVRPQLKIPDQKETHTVALSLCSSLSPLLHYRPYFR